MVIVFSHLSMAKPSSADVDQVFAKYRKAGGFQSDVKKTVTQEVLGTETSSSGKFYFSGGKVRLQMEEPENTTLVFDGKVVWMESRLDADTVQVTKIKSGNLKKSDSIWTTLFDRKNLAKAFTLKSAKKDGDARIYTFIPRNKKSTEVRQLDIGVKDGELTRIAYKDDRENRVQFDFDNLTKKPGKADLFAYHPPKGATITEM